MHQSPPSEEIHILTELKDKEKICLTGLSNLSLVVPTNMGKNFWLMFAIQQAIAVAEVFVTSSALTEQQKTDLQAIITAGQKFVGDF